MRVTVCNIGRHEGGEAVRTEWCYDDRDPLAIRATFFPNGDSVPWTFARSLLVDAMADTESRWHGVGDVQVCHYRDECEVALLVHSPEGRADLTFAAADIKWVLDRVATVAPGHVSLRRLLDDAVDAAIAACFEVAS